MTIVQCIPIVFPLVADMQQAQLMMVAGFVMLGWVLARRQIRMRKRVNRDAGQADRAIHELRHRKDPAVPLCDAPPETQRWQAAMFDLQRELKAELDTRIVVVQTLLRQMDQRIEQLSTLESSRDHEPSRDVAAASRAKVAGERHQAVERLLHRGYTAKEIATETGLSQGDVELMISTIRFG